MDPHQWELLQQMLAARQAAQMRDPSLRRNAVPGQGSMANTGEMMPGPMGGQSGPSSPWDQVPGGGSTQNAMAAYNPMVEDRRGYSQMADDGFATSLAGYGTALGAMALPPNPLSLALALGGMGLGFGGGLAQGHGTRNARRLGYQGN